jgi:glc operon protein GlcG
MFSAFEASCRCERSTFDSMMTESTIEYAEARLALEAILADVSKRGKAAVIAVCDAHGDLIAFARMDGAPLSSITIAMNKAYSAARERKPTKEIGNASRNPEKGFDIGYFGDPRFTGWGGGIPVWKNGRVIGALAVSGLPEAEDIELAEMGVAVMAG